MGQMDCAVLVHSLTSASGERLNGCTGVAEHAGSGAAEQRLTVRVDGVSQPKSLKRINLHYVTPAVRQFGVGVGRASLQELDWQAVLCLDDQMVSSSANLHVCARSSGNLAMLLNACLSGSIPPPATLAIALTDLNIVRACRQLVLGQTVLLSRREHREPLKQLERAVKRRQQAGGKVVAAFLPHRVSPDAPDSLRRRGTYGCASERVGAVVAGAFLIYPSPHPRENDALEVRYLHATPGQARLVAHQERFLDYGEEETLVYARDAVALGDISRLAPLELAAVDPQAFWAAVLRIQKFVRVLDELSRGERAHAEEVRDVISKWKELMEGVAVSQSSARSLASSPWNYDVDEWDVSTPAKHEEVAVFGAYAAVLLVSTAYPDELMGSRTITIELVDEQQHSSRFTKLIEAISEARGGGKEALAAAMLRKGLVSEAEAAELTAVRPQGRGLKIEVMSLRLCSACGARELRGGVFRACSTCVSAHYCSKACQVAHWRGTGRCFVAQHKLVCTSELGSATRKGLVGAMLYPGDPRVRPYAIWVNGGASGCNYKTAYKAVASSILDCPPERLKSSVALRHEHGEDGRILVLHLSDPPPSAQPNLRASTVISDRFGGPIATGRTAKVIGDAVVVRRGDGDTLTDFTYKEYQRNHGLFSLTEIPGRELGLSWIFGETREGELMNMEMCRMIERMSRGERIDRGSMEAVMHHVYGSSAKTHEETLREEREINQAAQHERALNAARSNALARSQLREARRLLETGGNEVQAQARLASAVQLLQLLPASERDDQLLATSAVQLALTADARPATAAAVQELLEQVVAVDEWQPSSAEGQTVQHALEQVRQQEMRACRVCGERKNAGSFTQNQWRNGRRRRCKACQEANLTTTVELRADLLAAEEEAAHFLSIYRTNQQAEYERVQQELARRNALEHGDDDCPICMEVASQHDRRHMPCSAKHWLCITCLRDLVRSQRDRHHTVPCPSCRAEVPDKVLDQLLSTERSNWGDMH